MIHQSHLDAMVTVDDPLPELNLGKPSPEEDRIGQLIADNLVQDGATLQMGILSVTSRQGGGYQIYLPEGLFGK